MPPRRREDQEDQAGDAEVPAAEQLTAAQRAAVDAAVAAQVAQHLPAILLQAATAAAAPQGAANAVSALGILAALASVRTVPPRAAAYSFSAYTLEALPAIGLMGSSSVPLARSEQLERDLRAKKGDSLVHEAPFAATYVALTALLRGWADTFQAALTALQANNQLAAQAQPAVKAALDTLDQLLHWQELVAKGRLTCLEAFVKDGRPGIDAMNLALFGPGQFYSYPELEAVSKVVEAQASAAWKAAAKAAAATEYPPRAAATGQPSASVPPQQAAARFAARGPAAPVAPAAPAPSAPAPQ